MEVIDRRVQMRIVATSALALFIYGCGSPLAPSDAPCAARKIAGTWERISTEVHPLCQGMIVQFNQGTRQGVVQSSPAGCAFRANEVKWIDLDDEACTWSDLRRAQSGSGLGSFSPVPNPVELTGQELLSREVDGPNPPIRYRRR